MEQLTGKPTGNKWGHFPLTPVPAWFHIKDVFGEKKKT